jgi:hypothetical protein
MVHLLPEALQDLMTARNLNLFLLAVRMTSAGAVRREAILDVIGMEVNPKVVKGFGVGKILQLLRKVVRESLEIPGKMWRDSSDADAPVKKARPGSSGLEVKQVAKYLIPIWPKLEPRERSTLSVR